eukprot:tig00000498_g1678.t1
MIAVSFHQRQSRGASSVSIASPGRQIGEYIIQSKIGDGAFSTVWMAQHVRSRIQVAVKIIDKSKVNQKLLDLEIEILKRMRHPNIVELYEILTSKSSIFLVLEYCAGGDLAAYLKRRGPLPEPAAQHFLKQLASALQHIYNLKMMHRDLKPQNLLLTEKSDGAVLKLADFGLARFVSDETLAAYTLCGTPLYTAPEILMGEETYTAKADLWSTGVIFFEMLTGQSPVTGRNLTDLVRNVQRGDIRWGLLRSQSDECMDLLRRLLKRNPAFRMSFPEFFRHAYIREPGLGNYLSLLLLGLSWQSLSNACMPCIAQMRGNFAQYED